MKRIQNFILLALLCLSAPLAARADARADLIAQGQYVTRAADCEACHTAPGGQPFAGGRAFVLPFGVLYSPNITPDSATGIAGYSDQDWLRMLHQGPSKKREEALKLLQANRYNWRLYLTMEEICHPKLTHQPHRFPLAPKHFTSAWSILHCLKALQLYAKPYKLTPKSWTTIMSRK